MTSPRRGTHRHTIGLAAGVIASISLLGACGSDDDAEDSFCQAGDDLSSNVTGLADVDIVSDGTSAVEEQIDAIESNITELRESGADVAADELDALDVAVEQLDSALSGLGSGVTAEDARAAIEAVGAIVGAAGEVFDKLSTTCG